MTASRRWGRVDLGWFAVLAAAILLPVGATSTWLNATYSATRADVVAGVWLHKLTVAILAVTGIALARYHGPESAAPRPVDRAGSWFPLLVVLFIALGLRLYRIDTELWLDEIELLTRYAPLELRQLVSTYDSQNHQPLYSIMAHLSFMVAGGSDWSVRVPAVLLGVGSLAAFWTFARRVASSNEALLGTILLAVSYHHVWFSQNARGYTTMLLFVLLATAAYYRLLEGQGRASRLAWQYAILMALATYTHLTAALIAVGHALTLLLTTRWTSAEARRQATGGLIAIGLSALLTLCLYALMFPQVWRLLTVPTMEGVAVEWTGAGWMLREGMRVLASGIPGGLLTVTFAIAILAVGVASYWRQSRKLTLLMFLPVVVTGTAIIMARHNLWPRFFFFAAGFFVLAALRGGFVLVKWVVRWHPERVAVAGASAVAVLSLLTVPRAWQPKQQFSAAYEFVEQQRRPGDEVVALDIVAQVSLMRGWTGTWRGAFTLDELADAERGAKRLWIVYTLPTKIRAQTPELFEYVSAERFEVIRVFPATVGGGEIHILRHDPATSHD